MSAVAKKDDRVFERLREKVRDIDKRRVKVGILEARGSKVVSDDGYTLSEIAAIHEFGAPKAGIPERSFLRRTFQETEGQEALRNMITKIAKAVIAERVEIEQGLAILGEFAVSQIKGRMVAHIPPPLAIATIKKKGSSTPLVDTGQLINSITYEVQ